ncbi:CDP-alcohol phosphatidyltransferase family protein [Pseudaquidulcibacter saccharophilus]|uniref:CDP-alcohol phosphatidyltransferase family protein n=1 Tax=Pseudaquidulcibacter saccharophilus TaxID=2831900 RepID=UPI001EFF07F7|nr:CDP-alcohol phosphatidyltransferase family protein [Pseudaquidulcibacter saccharophilus]
MKRQIPTLLIIFRFICGIVIFATCHLHAKFASIICVTLLALGVLSDIFDGVIARKYNIATDRLRVWDSRVDVVFWLMTAIGLFILYPSILNTAWIMLAVLGGMELVTRAISRIRFKREASPHHLLSKIFTLFLWAMISSIFINGKIDTLFWVTLFIGIISQLEAMAIMLIIPEWKCDIKNIFVALQLKEARKQMSKVNI